MAIDQMYRIRKELQKNLPHNQHYVVGVSGGSDSVALAYAMQQEGYDFTAVVVDHQLQEDSADFSNYAKTLMKQRGIDCIIEKVHVEITDTGVEDAARTARYNALYSHGEHLVVGHTKSDQAETVLIGLQQGSGSSALSGMRIVSHHSKGTVYRPMLENITKENTQQACEEYNVQYWNDPHNDSDDYTRVRVRNTVIPTMSKELHVDVVDKLAKTSFMVQQERDFIAKFVEDAYTQCVVKPDVIDISMLNQHEPLIVSRVVAQFIKTHAGCIKKAWVDDACALVYNYEGNKSVQVKRGELRFQDKKITWEGK